MIETLLSDQSARAIFCHEVERNASVIAPAGVGKTWSIVERIVSLAQQGGRERLEPLVVVTYTRKAAQQMRERAQERLAKGSPETQKSLQAAFFGTIHSFCLKLISDYGHLLDLPPLAFEPDETVFWLRFLREEGLGGGQPPELLRRALPLPQLLRLACGSQLSEGHEDPGPPPSLEGLRGVLDYVPKGVRTAAGVRASQEALALWLRSQQEADSGYTPLPEYILADSDFRDCWMSAWAPFKAWLVGAASAWVGPLAERYRQFCLKHGVLTYDSMLHTAAWALRQDFFRKKIQSQQLNVILDEAQDTDRVQFEVLLGVASTGSAQEGVLPYVPAGGRFSMVGDPQQSIFGERADLKTYVEIEKTLCAQEVLERLVFSVTFRCSQKIVEGLNRFFPKILKKSESQHAEFVPLQARSDASAGGLFREVLPAPAGEGLPTGVEDRAFLEAQALAGWIAQKGLLGLGLKDWSGLALLAPRNAWLVLLQKAFRLHKLPCQLLSDRGTGIEDPAYRWTLSLLRALADPTERFSVAEVLRVFFGCSDVELSAFVDQGYCLSLVAQVSPPVCSVTSALGTLASWHEAIVGEGPLAAWGFLQAHLEARLGVVIEEGSLRILCERFSLSALEAQGLSFEAWVQRLVQDPACLEPAPVPRPGHIQLLSCHKAKGLEWDVVILPFLSRPILQAHKHFPRVQVQGGQGCLELFKGDTLLAKEAYVAELERLLYVASTRARQTLIYVDAENYYGPSKGGASSFAALLQLQDANRVAWEALEALPQAALPAGACVEPPHPLAVQGVPNWLRAQERSCKGFTIQSPSALGLRVPQEAHLPKEDSSASAGLGPNYGRWWHALMLGLPWGEPAASWEAFFSAFLEKDVPCPDPERAYLEWQLFMRSPFIQKLREHGKHFWPELSVFAPNSFERKASAWEGTVDLLVATHEGGYWLVDWKTQRTPPVASLPSDPAALQVQAYAEALEAVLGQGVQPFIYFSSSGDSRALPWSISSLLRCSKGLHT